MLVYAELVYNGYWFSKKRLKLQKSLIKRIQVSGEVVLSLYKGNVTILSRRTKNKVTSMKKFLLRKTKLLIREK